MPDRLLPQHVVEYQGRRGVTCPDFMNCCDSTETPVVFDGEEGFIGIPTTALTVIGPENAKPEPRRCGAGRGAECCIFLTVGAGGFMCERFSPFRFTLIGRKEKMSAQREPTALYPACMFPEEM